MDLGQIERILTKIAVLLERNVAENVRILVQQESIGWDGVLLIVVAALTLFVAVLAFATSLQMKRLQKAASKRDKIYQELMMPRMEQVTAHSIYSISKKYIYLYVRLENVGYLPAKPERFENVQFVIDDFPKPTIERVIYGKNNTKYEYSGTSNKTSNALPILTGEFLDIAIKTKVPKGFPEDRYERLPFGFFYNGIKEVHVYSFNSIAVDYLVDFGEYFSVCKRYANTNPGFIFTIPDEVLRRIETPSPSSGTKENTL